MRQDANGFVNDESEYGCCFRQSFCLEMGIPSYLIARFESFPRESINHQISSMNLFIYLFNNHFEKSTCLISCCQLEWNQLAWNHVRCYKLIFVAYGTTDRYHIIMFIFLSLAETEVDPIKTKRILIQTFHILSKKCIDCFHSRCQFWNW